MLCLCSAVPPLLTRRTLCTPSQPLSSPRTPSQHPRTTFLLTCGCVYCCGGAGMKGRDPGLPSCGLHWPSPRTLCLRAALSHTPPALPQCFWCSHVAPGRVTAGPTPTPAEPCPRHPPWLLSVARCHVSWTVGQWPRGALLSVLAKLCHWPSLQGCACWCEVSGSPSCSVFCQVPPVGLLSLTRAGRGDGRPQTVTGLGEQEAAELSGYWGLSRAGGGS